MALAGRRLDCSTLACEREDGVRGGGFDLKAREAQLQIKDTDRRERHRSARGKRADRFTLAGPASAGSGGWSGYSVSFTE